MDSQTQTIKIKDGLYVQVKKTANPDKVRKKWLDYLERNKVNIVRFPDRPEEDDL